MLGYGWRIARWPSIPVFRAFSTHTGAVDIAISCPVGKKTDGRVHVRHGRLTSVFVYSEDVHVGLS